MITISTINGCGYEFMIDFTFTPTVINNFQVSVLQGK